MAPHTVVISLDADGIGACACPGSIARLLLGHTAMRREPCLVQPLNNGSIDERTVSGRIRAKVDVGLASKVSDDGRVKTTQARTLYWRRGSNQPLPPAQCQHCR